MHAKEEKKMRSGKTIQAERKEKQIALRFI